MKSLEYQSLLQQLGLSAAEAKLFEILLRDGELSATVLSRRSGLSRPNTYNVLKTLRSRGVVELCGQGSKMLFRAEHPEKLRQLLDEQRQRLLAGEKTLEVILPQMISDFLHLAQRVGVYRFEGRDGMIKAYEGLIRDKLDVSSIQNRGVLRNFLADYNPKWLAARRRNKIFNRVITPASDNAILKNADDRFELREVRLAPANFCSFNMDLKITAQKVVMTTFHEQSAVGIVIIDTHIAANFLILFEFLWQQLKPIS